MTYWMCTTCGHCLNPPTPPDKCPHCQQVCSFRDVTCYRPECGGEQNIDPLLAGATLKLMTRVAVSTEMRSRTAYVTELTVVQLLDRLTEEQKQKILNLGVREVYETGTIICRENDEAKNLYLLEQGTVAVEIESSPVMRIPVCTISKGGIFGWSCLVPPHRLTASVTSLEKSEALSIDGAKLRELCIQDSTLGFTIMQNISQIVSSRLKNLKLELISFVYA